jgi:hypothetical protein
VIPEDPRISHGDREIIRAARTGQGLIRIESADQLAALAEAAQTARAAFDERFATMTPQQARFVRQLRVDGEYTWRAVAETCAIEWDGDWGSNQLAGMALCARAADHFGEDYMTSPWN